MPHEPTVKQREFSLYDCLEAFYGGAAGAGKSEVLLMGALQYVDVPDYAALILRKSFSDLSLPGAIMDRADKWLRPTGAEWHAQNNTWKFPSGATLTFGYLAKEKDMYRYQSSEFQYIGIDELTQFPEKQYRYMFSRLRRCKSMSFVPVRMRSASNPGNIGHAWVKKRFITGRLPKHRKTLRASIKDNPHIDEEEYRKSLAELDPVTVEQLLAGNWDATIAGQFFKRQWMDRNVIDVDQLPKTGTMIRFWDGAATAPDTEKRGKSDDPDWNSGTKMLLSNGLYYFVDVECFRAEPAECEDKLKDTAQADGRKCIIGLEQGPGEAGKKLMYHYAKNVLNGYTLFGELPQGSKRERALPLVSAMKNGLVRFVRGDWNDELFDELEAFPYGAHDDQVDSSSGAHRRLSTMKKGWALGPAEG